MGRFLDGMAALSFPEYRKLYRTNVRIWVSRKERKMYMLLFVFLVTVFGLAWMNWELSETGHSDEQKESQKYAKRKK